jgi:ribose 5-phosphate isomerase A
LSIDDFKREAANAAVERYVESGMVVGLGTGTTATLAVRRIGELLASGDLKDISGIPTSARTMALANEVGIPLATLAENRPHLTIDGTDEVAPDLALIKGRGGALLREKIVASSSEEGLIVVADSSKVVDLLGVGPLPVEIDSFGWQPELRTDQADPDHPFVTDGGHYTADCKFDSIPDPASLEIEIKQIPGALECGLFVSIAQAAIIAGNNGTQSIGA